jgi:hypothetical protein
LRMAAGGQQADGKEQADDGVAHGCFRCGSIR